MELLDCIRNYRNQYSRDSSFSAQRLAALFKQVDEWMETARRLLGEARCYVSCDIHSSEDYGTEARKLYDELCLFGADQMTVEDVQVAVGCGNCGAQWATIENARDDDVC